MDVSRIPISFVLVLLGLAIFITYDITVTNGQDQILDGAYISYCESNGGYCFLETKYWGETSIRCNEYKKCILIDKTKAELEQEEIFKNMVGEALKQIGN